MFLPFVPSLTYSHTRAPSVVAKSGNKNSVVLDGGAVRHQQSAPGKHTGGVIGGAGAVRPPGWRCLARFNKIRLCSDGGGVAGTALLNKSTPSRSKQNVTHPRRCRAGAWRGAVHLSFAWRAWRPEICIPLQEASQSPSFFLVYRQTIRPGGARPVPGRAPHATPLDPWQRRRATVNNLQGSGGKNPIRGRQREQETRERGAGSDPDEHRAVRARDAAPAGRTASRAPQLPLLK